LEVLIRERVGDLLRVLGFVLETKGLQKAGHPLAERLLPLLLLLLLLPLLILLP
jgi:hypothetical protein